MKDINHIVPDTSDYLQIATTIAKAPKSLYFIGALLPSRRPTVAIVGSRKMTAYGREVTQSQLEPAIFNQTLTMLEHSGNPCPRSNQWGMR